MWRFKKIKVTHVETLRSLESDDRRVGEIRFTRPITIIVCTIPVDPAGGHCYWDPIKPCESRGFGPRLTAQ